MVLNICEHLDRNEINFDYLVYKNEKEINEDRAIALGGRKLVADNSMGKNGPAKFFIKFCEVHKVMKEAKPDIFHMNVSTPYDTLVGIAAKMAGVKKVVAHSHDAGTRKHSKVKKLIYATCRLIMPLYVDAYFTCSTEAAEYMFPKHIVKNKKYAYIKNGINVDKFRFDKDVRNRLRREHCFEDKLVIGNVGRFMKQKNHSYLIDVFREVKNNCPEAVLLLVGVGDLEEDIRKKVKASGLENDVIFYGATDKVNEVMMMMDIFVMTSFHEGLPVVGIEAQSTGLPCLFADTVTKEVKITDNVEFAALSSSTKVWSDIIIRLGTLSVDRSKGADSVLSANYSITQTTENLRNRYLEIYNK